MAENVYEGMFIFDSNRYARDPGGVSSQLSQMIEESGGTILASRLWEERRLAYPISGHRKGTYWLTYFRLEGTQLPALNRASQLNESVLRSLVLKVDPRIVEPLVNHALQRPTEAEKPAEKPRRPEPVAAGAGRGDEAGSEEEE